MFLFLWCFFRFIGTSDEVLRFLLSNVKWWLEEGKGLDVEHVSYCSHIMFKYLNSIYIYIYRYDIYVYPSRNTHRSTYQKKSSKQKVRMLFLMNIFP